MHVPDWQDIFKSGQGNGLHETYILKKPMNFNSEKTSAEYMIL